MSQSQRFFHRFQKFFNFGGNRKPLLFFAAMIFGCVGMLHAQETDPNSTPPGAPLFKHATETSGSKMIKDHPGNAGQRVTMSNITIIESQSFNSGHAMDNVWFNLLTGMGHMPTIRPQTALDNTAFFSAADALIVSSGVIALTPARVATIQQFMQSGKPVYLQGEYLPTYTSNGAFRTIVNNTGGTFATGSTVAGQLNPTSILNTYATTPNSVASIGYHWYGCTATGCDNVEYFMRFGVNNIGWVYCPISSTYGDMIQSSDQDWVNQSTSLPLMQNIIFHLLSGSACSVVCGSVLAGQEVFMAGECIENQGVKLSWKTELPIFEGKFRVMVGEETVATTLVDPSGQSNFEALDALVPNEATTYNLFFETSAGNDSKVAEFRLENLPYLNALRIGKSDDMFRAWYFGSEKILKMNLLDLTGKQFPQKSDGIETGTGVAIQLDGLSPGIYILQLDLGNGQRLTKKLVW